MARKHWKTKTWDKIEGEKFHLGAKPSPRDKRDYRYSEHYAGVKAIDTKLPPSADLRKRGLMPNMVRDQGQLGACTGFAIASMMESYRLNLAQQDEVYSPLFIYFYERQMENTIPYDQGANIRDGMKVLNVKGVCFESKWPYDPAKFTEEPGFFAQFLARFRRITNGQILYAVPDSITEIKHTLAFGLGTVIGIDCWQEIFTAPNGDVPMPVLGQDSVGGHAIHLCGYDDKTQRFTFRNSWSYSWGAGGFGTLPYQYVLEHAFDMWTILTK